MTFKFGDTIGIKIFGDKDSSTYGLDIKGFPEGLSVDFQKLQDLMDRRKLAKSRLSSEAQEDENVKFTSGIDAGITTGATIHVDIENKTNDTYYEEFRNCPRPSHEDFSAYLKYGKDYTMAGGGLYSGKITVPICISGGLCMQALEDRGIRIGSHIASIGNAQDIDLPLHPTPKFLETLKRQEIPVISNEAAEKMFEEILNARKAKDSVGGVIECVVTNMPCGIGGPLFEGLDGKLSEALFAIPGVKGVEFGSGFKGSKLLGSQNNDPFYVAEGENSVTDVFTRSNNHGGVLGGISSGMPIVMRVAIKPTPSIGKAQDTVNLETLENTKISIKKDLDPCMVLRAVPLVESTIALAIADAIFTDESKKRIEEKIKESSTTKLELLRKEVDLIDDEMLRLFMKRMDIIKQVGVEKAKHSLPIEARERESEILDRITRKSMLNGSDYAIYARELFFNIMTIGKKFQQSVYDQANIEKDETDE